jgi:starch phosphorylase
MDTSQRSEVLAQKSCHYLMSVLGRLIHEATDTEVYQALCFAMREEIMVNWLASARTFDKNRSRMVYYLSLEFLPGKIFENNCANLGWSVLLGEVCQKLGKNFQTIISKEHEPALGNGGLGRLASCFMDSLAVQHYPAQGYGLRYQYGIFEQQIWDGVQVEAPDLWLSEENPWQIRRDLRKVNVLFSGNPKLTTNKNGDEVWEIKNAEEVYALPYDFPIVGVKNGAYSVLTLRLWSTKESPRNFHLQRFNAGRLDQAAENITLTDVLYPSDHHETGLRIRLKQEFLLVSASLQDIIRHHLNLIGSIDHFQDRVRIQINDTHPALVVAELIRLLITKHNIPWKQAVEITHEVVSYTNHTIMREALEEWDRNLFFYLLPRQYKIIERLNHEFCFEVRKNFPMREDLIRSVSIIENNKVRMANLAIVGSHKVNGVSKLHADILVKDTFRDFHEIYPDKFIGITNGVTQRRWLLVANPLLADWITSKIGPAWITDFEKIEQLKNFADNPDCQQDILKIKRKNKERLIHFIQRENKIRDEKGMEVACIFDLNPDSLFDVQVKRIHEYKRQLMNILHVVMLYQELHENPYHKRVARTVIFAGKAAAQYETAKQIIRFINAVARRVNRDERIGGALKVIYIENYNVTHAERIMPAADLSEQISCAGMEASGTGNMKLTMNGSLTIGTDDGANVEMRESVGDTWWPFLFGYSSQEVERIRREGGHPPIDVLQDLKIKAALESLQDYSFATTPEEHAAFCKLYQSLVESHYGGPPDNFFTVRDLKSYVNTQAKVEELFSNPSLWAQYVIHNIAGMGKFSSDVSIRHYAEEVWNVAPCPLDKEILNVVRQDFLGKSLG